MSTPTPAQGPLSDRITDAIVTTQVEADPSRPHKAYVASALAAVGTFVAYWVADTDPFTAKEVGQALIAALVASGVTGGATFKVPNPLRRRPPKHQKG